MMDSPSNEPDSSGRGSEQSYPPRVCRICLETVWPTVQPSEFLRRSRLVYESSDPESGRLLRPCKCRGSSRYVHEGCLQSWRLANPGFGTRNYWECPTCRFQYRLERLTWARWISSTATQLVLTLAILLLTIFLLGFIADPVIDLYVGPLDDTYFELDEEASWLEHFVKGFAALGLTSFLRVLFTFSPPYWIRGSGVVSNGRSTGRNRAANLNWLVILAGVATFFWTVYKGVRSWSKRTLQWAGEKVMDVPLPEDEDEDDIVTDEPSTHPKADRDHAETQDPELTNLRREFIDSEPFSDYDDESAASDEVEQAYQDAFTAAVQEEIRARVVEPNILILDHIAVDQRLKTLDAMKGSLSHPQLRSKTRMRFIALTSMVIRLKNALFSVSDEDSFLNPKATANAQSIATVILAFASWVDGMMQELLLMTGSVDHMLGLLIVEDVAWVIRYRRMALLVSTHLKKPRRLEEALLSMYLELYDEWVHNVFLRLRNAQVTQEENLDFDRLQLTRKLHAIWDILSRAIERYDIYRNALHSIKGRFFSPAVMELSGSRVARCFEEDTV